MTNGPEYLRLHIKEVELRRIGIGLDASRSLRGVLIHCKDLERFASSKEEVIFV
jgi:hypothetical protein